MRSILLIFFTLVLVAGGFFAYLWFQPEPAAPGSGAGPTSAPVALVPASRPTEAPDPNLLGGGGASTNIYIKTIDEKTGELSNEFRAARFDPRKDGTVDVTEPEAKFYLAKSESGQVLVIRGKTGKVVIPDSASKRSQQLKGAPNTAPTRGQLQDVTILVFDRPDSAEPTLTCSMNNASFDQETFRIQTESYERNGRIVPADQVEVQVRGRDYDFDGRGLDIRWNERDRRLQSLEIAHGEELTVKHPEAIRSFAGPTTAPTASLEDRLPLAAWWSSALAPAKPQAENLLPLLASADPASVGDAISSAPQPSTAPTPHKKKKKAQAAPAVAPVKIVRDKSAPIFRATFMDNVKIAQADATLATANTMHVDFVMESSKSTTQPATQSTTQEAAAAAAAPKGPPKTDAAEPKSLAAISRTSKKPPTTAPSESPDKKRAHHTESVAGATPATQPAEPPISILWTGKLRVTPLDVETQDPPTRQDTIVTLLGEPAVLKRGDGEVDCAMVRYHTQDSSVRMESSQTTPQIVMKDAMGSVLRTPTLDYSGGEGIAVLRGPSQADLLIRNPATTQPAVAEAPATQPQMMHASWTRTCRLFLTGEARENMSIDRAEIDGDVTVDHPQVKGRSDQLELAFQKTPTTRPTGVTENGPTNDLTLKQLDADGKVHYVLTSNQASAGPSTAKSQTIDCEHLTLETAQDQNNKTYASAMTADGSVHAFDDTQDMQCGELSVKFKPSTRPSTQPSNGEKFDTASIEVQSLLARQDVRISNKQGNSATADQLEMQSKNGVREVTLFGHPFAKVVQKDNVLSGPIIKFDPDTNRAAVVGAGTMHAVQVAQNADKNSKPQPMDLSWAGNLSANGDLNLIDITEKVAIAAKTSDGAVNTAHSDRLKLTLMDDPRAATRPSFPTAQKVKKEKSGDMAGTGFGDADFFKNKVVKTVEMQDNANVLSVLNDPNGKLLRRLYMQSTLMRYDMQDKIFLVPAPGQLLIEDESKSSKSTPDNGGDVNANDMSGTTVFEWKRELRYDENQHRMTMSSNVGSRCHIEHESSAENKPFTLYCRQIVADLEPAPTTQPTSAPTTSAAESPANQKMRLKHVTASDQVEFISLPVHFEASSIDYDPNTHILIARGTDRVRAELYDEKGTVNGSFTELHYNTQTGRIDETIGFRTTFRK